MSKTTKSFPLIQGILGMDKNAKGIDTISTMTGKSGVQIKEAGLEQIETALQEKDKAVTEANASVTAHGTAVDAALTAAGLTDQVDADATTEEKITALGAAYATLAKKPGANVTKPKSTGDTAEDAEDGKTTKIIDSLK